MNCERHTQSPLVTSDPCLLCTMEQIAKERDDALYRVTVIEEDLHSEMLAKESALDDLENARLIIAQAGKMQHALEQLGLICEQAVEILDEPVFQSTEYENALDALRAAGYLDDKPE